MLIELEVHRADPSNNIAKIAYWLAGSGKEYDITVIQVISPHYNDTKGGFKAKRKLAEHLGIELIEKRHHKRYHAISTEVMNKEEFEQLYARVAVVALSTGYVFGGGINPFSSTPENTLPDATYQTTTSDESPAVAELESNILKLEKRIAEYQDQTESLTHQILSLEEDKTNLESERLSLEAELAQAEAQLGEARSAKQSLESQVSNLQSRIASLNSEIQTKAAEITRLANEKEALEDQMSSLQATVDSQNARISALESERNRILGTVVIQHYEHMYGGWLWQNRYQWDLDIPLSLYWEYHSRQRPTSYAKWVAMAKDTGDDRYIDEIVRQINSAAIEEGFTEKEKVEFVIAFVQSLPYTEDKVTTPWNEYPRYPVETLFDRSGDCEDTSILVTALLDRMGYNTTLLLLYKEYHAAVGVAIAGASGSYYTVGDERYYYLETTGEGFKIGQIPSEFDEKNAYVYPLNP